MDGIADYYQRQDDKAQELSRLLAAARADGASADVIRDLERKLEMARYVGD
jgi:hypothetical protein